MMKTINQIINPKTKSPYRALQLAVGHLEQVIIQFEPDSDEWNYLFDVIEKIDEFKRKNTNSLRSWNKEGKL